MSDLISVGDMNEEDLEEFVRNMRTSRTQRASIDAAPTSRRKTAAPKKEKKITPRQLAKLMGITLSDATKVLAAREEVAGDDDAE